MATHHVSDEQIIEAARAALREKGARATARDIARHAGIGKSTINDRFGSKQALLLEAILVEPPPWSDDLPDAIGRGDVRENVAGLAREMVAWFRAIAPVVTAALATPTLARTIDLRAIRGERHLATYLEAEMWLGRLRGTWESEAAHVVATLAWDAALERRPDAVTRALHAIWKGLALRPDDEGPPSSGDPVHGRWPPPPPSDPVAHAANVRGLWKLVEPIPAVDARADAPQPPSRRSDDDDELDDDELDDDEADDDELDDDGPCDAAPEEAWSDQPWSADPCRDDEPSDAPAHGVLSGRRADVGVSEEADDLSPADQEEPGAADAPSTTRDARRWASDPVSHEATRRSPRPPAALARRGTCAARALLHRLARRGRRRARRIAADRAVVGDPRADAPPRGQRPPRDQEAGAASCASSSQCGFCAVPS